MIIIVSFPVCGFQNRRKPERYLTAAVAAPLSGKCGGSGFRYLIRIRGRNEQRFPKKIEKSADEDGMLTPKVIGPRLVTDGTGEPLRCAAGKCSVS
jgi:hypothetical protein